MHTGNVLKGDVSARVSIQWLVKNNTVTQQIVVTNTADSSIEDFPIRTRRDMLIRDLDYLQSSYRFNETDSDSYIRGRGPGAFSWITANVFESGQITTSQGNDAINTHANDTKHEDDGVNSPAARDKTLENKELVPSLRATSGELGTRAASSQGSLGRESAGVKVASADPHRHSTKEPKTVETSQGATANKSRRPPSDDELWRKRSITETWSAKDARAVISIMSLYVGGEAQKMEMKPQPIRRTIGAAGSSSSVLEITVAYRMIAIPKEKINWKNFVIPAETTDVSMMLAAETERIWGHSITHDCKCSSSLCDLGISMIDLKEHNVKQDKTGEEHTSENSEIPKHGAPKGMGAHDDTTTIANPRTDIETGQISTATDSPEDHEAAENSSTAHLTGVAVEDSQKLTPVNSIEYLTWRHTEYILSVCIIPLAPPLLVREDEVFVPTVSAENAFTSNADTLGTSNCKENELEVPLALTCGDMSGHRICISASL